MRTEPRSAAASSRCVQESAKHRRDPGKTVTRWRRIASTTRSGANRSTSATVAPTSRGASNAPLRPNECASGSVASTTSAATSAMTGPAHDSIASSSAECESTAPFGRPGAAGRVENQRRAGRGSARGHRRPERPQRGLATEPATSASSMSRAGARSSRISGPLALPSGARRAEPPWRRASSPRCSATAKAQWLPIASAMRSPAFTPPAGEALGERARPAGRARRT